MTNKLLIDRIFEGINAVIKDFQTNPYSFLYESDIKCALFSDLRKRICETVNVPMTAGGQYKLNLIYTEYHEKIDVVCLDPEEIAEEINRGSFFPSKGKHDTYIYNLPILVGIELKYIWMGSKMGFNKLKQDCLKLSELSGFGKKIRNWLALCFIQREEEAEPFISDMEKTCEANDVMVVEQLDSFYVVTPDRILSGKYHA